MSQHRKSPIGRGRLAHFLNIQRRNFAAPQTRLLMRRQRDRANGRIRIYPALLRNRPA